ncbi:hypothetical protein [Agromyces albus]|uniref:WXG100 family type VII secretion target n=1 Tax=Agromyces albus TaxID=205332 RepID=A0A4Q2KWF7_9MICO|nr:hypothetical protein [Agromyces albus]RXZ69935.1 hypothetical protein ESP51_10945 [Agromyces albus]
MAEQQADTAELRALAQTMTELMGYCSALKQGASGFAYMLPAEWQGPAMQAFLGSFAAWTVGATGMEQTAEALQKQAQAAFDAYDATIESLNTAWKTIESDLG